MQHPNIILIGMPGAGKSTLGVLLAKALGYTFLDSDVVLQAQEGRLLQEIIDADGVAGFLRIEERCLLSIDVQHTVIATGGSVVYSPAIMEHLRANGVTVWLELGIEELVQRIENFDSRGVVMADVDGQMIEGCETLAELYIQREPLYRQYADVTVHCGLQSHERSVAQIIAAVEKQTGIEFVHKEVL